MRHQGLIYDPNINKMQVSQRSQRCSVRFRIRGRGYDMETSVMGRVLTEATIENLKDLWDAERGLLPAEKARRINVDDALVDIGATLLSLPTRLIQQLGLATTGKKHVTSSVGVSEANMYEAVRLTI